MRGATSLAEALSCGQAGHASLATLVIDLAHNHPGAGATQMEVRMRGAAVVLTVVTALTLGAGPPAAAETASDPNITDPCGDADTMVRVEDTSIRSPGRERSAGFDIRAASFENLIEVVGDERRFVGVRVVLELCGDVPEEMLPRSHWAVYWDAGHWDVEPGEAGHSDAGKSCTRYLYLNDVVDEGDPSLMRRHAGLSMSCTEPTPVIPGSQTVQEWDAELPSEAVTVDGDRIVWTLTPGLLPAEQLDFLEPGTAWRSPRAYTHDGRHWTMAGSSWPVSYWVGGPGALDWAASEGVFVVAEP